jgi:hypothetical protein
MGMAIATTAGNLAAGVVSSALGAVTSFFSKGIQQSVELQDQVSMVGAVFTSNAKIITGAADEMAEKYGTVKTEFIGAAAGFGQVFKGAGKSQEEAAQLGVALTKLGMDMKSFKGGTTTNQEAFTALSAAMRGEFDPLERFGVMLTAEAVKQEALTMGLIKHGQELDAASKQTATYSLIMKKTADMQGDLGRTADQTGNSWSKLTGTITNMATEAGTALGPAIQAVIDLANDMLGSLKGNFGAVKETLAGWAEWAAGWAKTIGVIWRNAGDMFEIVKIQAKGMVYNAIAYLGSFADYAGKLGEWFGRNWFNLIRDAFNATIAIFKNFGENVHALGASIKAWFENPTKGFHFEWKPLLDGFKATTEALPEMLKPALMNVQGQIDEVGRRVADREGARLNQVREKAEAVKVSADRAAKAVGKKEKDFKSETVDTADFATRLREQIFSDKDEVPKKQLETLKQILDRIKEGNDEAKKKRPAVAG